MHFVPRPSYRRSAITTFVAFSKLWFLVPRLKAYIFQTHIVGSAGTQVISGTCLLPGPVPCIAFHKSSTFPHTLGLSFTITRDVTISFHAINLSRSTLVWF